jgi:hypothetical protein
LEEVDVLVGMMKKKKNTTKAQGDKEPHHTTPQHTITHHTTPHHTTPQTTQGL